MVNGVVGFGDLLVRFNPEGYLRFSQAASMQIGYTGAEANVCVSLAHMGVPTAFVTRLPQNAIAECAVAELRRHNVSVQHIVWGGERMGLFYVEKGASQRPSAIVYDRKYSSMATASPEDFDWDAILEGAGYFHLTGITPALGESSPAVCEEALKATRRKGLVVSCDLNYRARMWSTARAGEVMRRLMEYVDVLIANEEDADKVLGIRADNTDVVKGKLSEEGYAQVARRLCKMYPFSAVGITKRVSQSASDNAWSAMYYTNGSTHVSRRYQIHLVDRVGGGDAFAAGLIYGIRAGFDPQQTVEFAAAASCLKQTMEMDFNLSTAEEVLRLVKGDGSGRVLR